jgi:FkbM family methyltransferase
MSIFRRLRNTIRRRIHHSAVKRRYGVVHPDVVTLPGSQNPIHIDPQDPRAWKILVMAPLYGRLPTNQTFWRQSCAQLNPGLALDVGLNFGECLFGADYGPRTELHAYEANPALKPFVSKSLAEHPARQQMHLHFGLVSDRPGPAQTFYVDQRWSGGSSAIAGLHPAEASRCRAIEVPVLTVDSTLTQSPAARPGGTLVFKIDVEGYEYRVLQGMQKTLMAPRWSVGLVEFDTELLTSAGESLEAYFAFLKERFEIYAFVKDTKASPARTWDELCGLFRNQSFHTDLLLTSGEADEAVARFVNEWTTGRAAKHMLRAA